MIKRSILLCAVAGLAVAGAPAHAAQFIADGLFNGTYTMYPPSGSPFPPTVIPISANYQGFTGDFDSALLDYIGNSPYDPPCTKCLSYTISGSTLHLTLLPGYHMSYGSMTMSVLFDQDLGGQLNNLRYAHAVSASMTSDGRGTGISVFSVTSSNFSVLSLPEPSTWGMLIAGFGLVGASMRRRREVSDRWAPAVE